MSRLRRAGRWASCRPGAARHGAATHFAGRPRPGRRLGAIRASLAGGAAAPPVRPSSHLALGLAPALLATRRKASDLPPHLDDIVAARPRAVWLQSGITNPEFEEALAREGIKVVSDRCLMVDHRRATGGRSAL